MSPNLKEIRETLPAAALSIVALVEGAIAAGDYSSDDIKILIYIVGICAFFITISDKYVTYCGIQYSEFFDQLKQISSHNREAAAAVLSGLVAIFYLGAIWSQRLLTDAGIVPLLCTVGAIVVNYLTPYVKT
ncbi:MAG: hypothetical protein ACFFCQ_13895 [Promethearchaeota archaeon]